MVPYAGHDLGVVYDDPALHAQGPSLYGRDAPLAALTAALDDACRERGQLAVVLGEPGIGKSAIARKLADAAIARGAVVTWGRAWEFADAPPYFPVSPCLRALGVVPGDDPFELWEATVAALANASAQRPVLWVLEDLHAADLGTLDLLAFLLQPLRAMRALVLLTVRTSDVRLDERMQRRLTRMARDGRVRLGAPALGRYRGGIGNDSRDPAPSAARTRLRPPKGDA